MLRRLRSVFSVHPHGPTPVVDAVTADLAAAARRRARGLAWAGLLVNIPLFYVDDWRGYARGAFDGGGWETFGAQLLTWRVTAVLTLALYLWLERRAPRSTAADRRWASGLAVWFALLGGWFGVFFDVNGPSYALYGLTLLLVAVLVHSPARWRLAAYPVAQAVALVGAWAWGTPLQTVLNWMFAFSLLTAFAVFVDRALYLQAYRNAESARLIGRANAELETALVELRETQDRLVEAERQAERTRISRDLHDSVGAQLSSLLAGVELARLGRASGAQPSVALDEVEADAREALAQLRETVWVLNTAEISAADLARQLQRFAQPHARRAGMQVLAQADGDRDRMLPSTHVLQLYRIGQEAVQNAIKHSGGTAVTVTITTAADRATLHVQDDGAFRPPVSINGDGAPSGFGLASMRERAAGLGGTLAMETDEGTAVRVSVPLTEAL